VADTFAERLQAALDPWMTTSLAVYATAIGAMFPVDAIVQDDGIDGQVGYAAGWSVLFDVDAVPPMDLPFLGQFVGVRVPDGADDATARALIKAEAGRSRGTAASIVSRVQGVLTGTKTVILRERTAADGSPDAYHIVIGTLTSESPAVAVIKAAVETASGGVKPAGIQITYVISDGFTFSEAIHTFSADTFSFDASLGTQP
jgi:hypothetical protein